jgi:hypothetical protein
MANPMDKPAPQNPQQAQNPQRNPGQGQKSGSRGQRDPSTEDPKQQVNPQERYASGMDRSREVPVDRKGGQEKPGGGRDDGRSGKH